MPELPPLVTRTFGTTPAEDIRWRATQVLAQIDGYKYRLALNPNDLAEVCMALRHYAQACENAPGECVNERSMMLYLDILSTLRIEEI